MYHVLVQLLGFTDVEVSARCTGQHTQPHFVLGMNQQPLSEGVVGFELDWYVVLGENSPEFLRKPSHIWNDSIFVPLCLFRCVCHCAVFPYTFVSRFHKGSVWVTTCLK